MSKTPDTQELIAERIRWQLRGALPPSVQAGSAAPLPRSPEWEALRDLEIDTELGRDVELAAERHDIRNPAWPGGRVRTFPARVVRGLLMRLLAPVIAQQAEVNGAVARSLALLRDRSTQLRDVTVGEQGSLRQLERRHDREFEDVRRSVRSVERALQRLRESQATVRLDYLDLTERFRGTEAEIADRQRGYVELFRDADPVVDLGCGRGEFLGLLRDAGVPARGVDSSLAMVSRCRERGLEAVRRDAGDYLEGADDDSLGGIFSAQVIEHFDVNELVRIVRLAQRKLRPGGVLLLEAPNPGSLRVLTDFTLDPTHTRLHHPEFVRWLLEQEGFGDVEVRYTLPELKDDDHLNDPLTAPQAYAVIGRRAA